MIRIRNRNNRRVSRQQRRGEPRVFPGRSGLFFPQNRRTRARPNRAAISLERPIRRADWRPRRRCRRAAEPNRAATTRRRGACARAAWARPCRFRARRSRKSGSHRPSGHARFCPNDSATNPKTPQHKTGASKSAPAIKRRLRRLARAGFIVEFNFTPHPEQTKKFKMDRSTVP